jgi:hypothetical protein
MSSDGPASSSSCICLSLVSTTITFLTSSFNFSSSSVRFTVAFALTLFSLSLEFALASTLGALLGEALLRARRLLGGRLLLRLAQSLAPLAVYFIEYFGLKRTYIYLSIFFYYHNF